MDPPNKRGWMTLFWNRVLLDLQPPPVTWDPMILRVSTGWSGVVVKWLKRQGETTPMRHANSTPNSTLKLLKTPRFACCFFFGAGNLNLRQNWCPTQVPEASQVYLRLELAIYFRCKKCHFSHPNCFGWWEAPLIWGFIWCGSSVCSKVVSTHLWNTPLNLYQRAIKGFLS